MVYYSMSDRFNWCGGVYSTLTEDQFFRACKKFFQGAPKSIGEISSLLPKGIGRESLSTSSARYALVLSWTFKTSDGVYVRIHLHSPDLSPKAKAGSHAANHYTCRIEIDGKFLIKDDKKITKEFLTRRSSDTSWNNSHIIMSP